MTASAAPAPSFADRPDPIPPELAASCRRLRAEVRAFLAGELAAGRFVPRCDAWLSGWDPGFSRRLAERGWVGMTIPAEYGGGGRSLPERHVVTVELLAAGAPVAAHWVADRQTAPSLLRYGGDAVKRRFLPAISRGECHFAIGMSEPDSGSDLASVRTRAVPADGGWLVDGRKVWTSGAHRAHAFFVLCRTGESGGDRHAGLSQLIVPLDAPGVEVRPIRLLTGEEHFNEVILDRVFVPHEMVLGEIGAGWHQVTSELAVERSGPERFMSTYPLLAALVERLGEAGRRPAEPSADPGGGLGGDLGGGPGGGLGGDLGAALGELFAELLVLRRLSWSIACRMERGASPEVDAALVKDLGTAFERKVVEVARRLAPAEPDLTAADPYERLLAEAVLHTPGFTLRGGTTEILRQIVARALLR